MKNRHAIEYDIRMQWNGFDSNLITWRSFLFQYPLVICADPSLWSEYIHSNSISGCIYFMKKGYENYFMKGNSWRALDTQHRWRHTETRNENKIIFFLERMKCVYWFSDLGDFYVCNDSCILKFMQFYTFRLR